MQIYLQQNGEQVGPYTEEQLREFVAAGTLTQLDLAWYEGLESWQPLNKILDFSSPSAPPQPGEKQQKSKSCPFCGEEILAVATKCKHCGSELKSKGKKKVAQKKKAKTSSTGLGCGCIVFIVVGFIISLTVSDCGGPKNPPIPDLPKADWEIRKERLQKGFSNWDGSHRGLTAVIKKSMNDPSSYEHVRTEYIDNEDHLIVTTTFRGKNAFGGIVVNSVKAKTDLDGNVIEVISQGR